MTFESQRLNEIPKLNASADEWKRYWDSCSLGEIVSTLEKLIQTDRKKKPIENKSLYIRALECKEILSDTVREVIEKNNKLIKDIELGNV
jgi:undecaprenyl pyrophosphate synthase